MTRRRKKSDRVFEQAFYRTTIKDWPEGERPREKMQTVGATNLSDAELLAILIRTGSRGVTAVDVAKKLLADGRTLLDLARYSVADLKALGVGSARASSIVAAFELARRYDAHDGARNPVFHTPSDVAGRYGPILRDLRHEEFWALLLTTSNRLIRAVRVTSGTLSSSLVHPRECFTDAIKEKAASVLFVHNHPSGNPEPSQEDRAITKQLVEAGEVLGIPVHDHIVIAGKSFTSFRERGWM
jgi:DNA repair protein RadC